MSNYTFNSTPDLTLELITDSALNINNSFEIIYNNIKPKTFLFNVDSEINKGGEPTFYPYIKRANGDIYQSCVFTFRHPQSFQISASGILTLNKGDKLYFYAKDGILEFYNFNLTLTSL